MAVVLGAAAGFFLMWQGNPYPVAGPLGAVLAIGARAAYLASEALVGSLAADRPPPSGPRRSRRSRWRR